MARKERFYFRLFVFAAILRLFALFPLIIDDDEAWWSASAHGMSTPWQFYQRAVDDKPPGTVWFYWISQHLIPYGSDPRVARAVFSGLFIGAAVLLGKASQKLKQDPTQRTAPVDWSVAALFLLLTCAASPELFSLTSDGLLSLLVIAAYAVVLYLPYVLGASIAGVLLGTAFLVKQTAVFFILPLLIMRSPRPLSPKEWLAGFLGLTLTILPAALALGASDFLYWTFTYPLRALVSVRSHVFASNHALLINLAIFAAVGLPLWILAFRNFSMRALRSHFRDLVFLWLIAAGLAVLVGHGLFLHYFLLALPPVVILVTSALRNLERPPRLALTWLSVPCTAGALLLVLPGSGVLWGTDLNYYGELQQILSRALRPGEKIFVWGGTTLPIVTSGAPYVTRFVVPRFGVSPYATRHTRMLFQDDLQKASPQLILDLHERGDNRFNNPPDSEPELEALLHAKYQLYVSPVLPWAKFYFRNPPPASSGLARVQSPEWVARLQAPFPEEKEPWLRFEQLISTSQPTHLFEKATALDWRLRSNAALELISLQGRNPETRERAAKLREKLKTGLTSTGLHDEIDRFLFAEGPPLPLPWRSLLWWPEVALVQLQPKVQE